MMPIAIVGRACVGPAGLTPEQFWSNILSARNCLQEAKSEYWRVDKKSVMASSANQDIGCILSDKGGYVSGFDKVFEGNNFLLPASFVMSLDPLCQWLIYTAKEALRNVNYKKNSNHISKSGAVIGNLSYPTNSFNKYAEAMWLKKSNLINPDISKINPLNRFMSGYPIQALAKAIGLTGDAYAIDAACASSIYAIKLACDSLQNGSADLMLAGGVNGVDMLFLHAGFSTIQALSRKGLCRPLHSEADGILPGEGAAIIVLKRLEDALVDKDPIFGIIRSIGLSNDASGRGFLVPSAQGQIHALQQAYQNTDIKPSDISWIECHATGTNIGDATEIESMRTIFQEAKKISIGALKGNIGHLMAASGTMAVIKVLESLRAKIKSPTIYAPDNPIKELSASPFQLHKTPETWLTEGDKPRRAAINSFGFGGNNAHLIIEEWVPRQHKQHRIKITQKQPIAVVGVGVIAGLANTKELFWQAILNNQSLLQDLSFGSKGCIIDQLKFDITKLHFPPLDLKQALGQQLAILKAVQDALHDAAVQDSSNATVMIGMQCDPTPCRHSFRWRLPSMDFTKKINQDNPDWLKQALNSIGTPFNIAQALGSMPNIVANRLNSQFNIRGPGYCVSAEELSGVVSLKLGCQSLWQQETDISIIGAVDMCCDEVHIDAASHLFKGARKYPGDAAIALVLRRLDDAVRDKQSIYAVIKEQLPKEPDITWVHNHEVDLLSPLFGHAHAASGLLNVLSAIFTCYKKQLPKEFSDRLVVNKSVPESAKVTVTAMGGQTLDILLEGFKNDK